MKNDNMIKKKDQYGPINHCFDIFLYDGDSCRYWDGKTIIQRVDSIPSGDLCAKNI